MIDAPFIEHCAPTVAVETVQAIIREESAGDPLALNANRPEGPTRLNAVDLVEAVRLARAELAAGNSVDIGLMQINSGNLAKLGLTLEEVFNPCTNLRAGAAILTRAYDSAQKRIAEPQAALQAALSHYNTGSFTRGFTNGYVARYYAQAQSAPRDPPIRFDPYSADTAVYVRPQQEVSMSEHTAANEAVRPITFADVLAMPLDPNVAAPAVTSRDYRDLMTAGVQVELDPDEATELGIVEEDALTADDAWASNGDPHRFEDR